MNKRTFKLAHATARAGALECVRSAPDGYVVVVSEPNRTLDQNATQWPILQAFEEQLDWPVNGVKQKISAESWKDILTAAFRNEQPLVAAGLNGGMVLLGQRTSGFSKREFSDWIEFLHSVASGRGVIVHQDMAA